MAPDDVWAVGSRANTTPPFPLGDGHTLILPLGLAKVPYAAHWDGQRWSIVTMPATGGRNGYFGGLAAVSRDDIWAVGTSYNGESNRGQTLVVHWDGRHWSIIPSPSPGGINNQLNGVAAISPGDVWAVGAYEDSSFHTQPLLLHWDGISWRVDRSLNLKSNGSDIRGIKAISGDDVWAVGYYQDSNAIFHALTIHWNGQHWNIIPTPANDTYMYPSAISISASDDIWAAGIDSLTMHWDGRRWSNVSNPGMIAAGYHLQAVAALSRTDAWVAGGDSLGGPALVKHWDGSTWADVSTPEVSPSQTFNGLAAASPNELWAVGGTLPGKEDGPWYALISHFIRSPCGK